ncbi:MAG: hypothetical protein QG597_2908 [Actinomycetota bacterium]|nr:hypothetical protein [Actinomycetota bacterium]
MTIPTDPSRPLAAYLFTCSICTSRDVDPFVGCEVTEPVFAFDTAQERDAAAAEHAATCGSTVHRL